MAVPQETHWQQIERLAWQRRAHGEAGQGRDRKGEHRRAGQGMGEQGRTEEKGEQEGKGEGRAGILRVSRAGQSREGWAKQGMEGKRELQGREEKGKQGREGRVGQAGCAGQYRQGAEAAKAVQGKAGKGCVLFSAHLLHLEARGGLTTHPPHAKFFKGRD